MIYTVVWEPAAEAELAQAWLDAPDRQAVSQASDKLERLLHYRPWDVGEKLDTNDRMLVVSPLGVIYEISEDDRMVRVLLLMSFR